MCQVKNKDFERYEKIVENLNKLKIKTVNFTFEYFLEKKEKSYYNTKIIFVCGDCGEEFERSYSNMIKEDRRKVCSKCSKKYKRTKLLTVDKVKKFVEKKGLKLISEEYSGEQSPIIVMCSCGEIYKTTYASVRNSGKTDGFCRCKKCAKEYSRNYFRMSFNEIKDYFKDSGCEIISDEDEYVNIFSEFVFIAKCGHEHKTTFQSFKNSKHKLCRKCTKKINSGENAYNWKGGTYDNEYIKFRKTYEFKKWRNDVFKRDNYTCQICGSYGGKLNAHHLDGYNWCEDRRTDVTNGVTLCQNCHDGFHNHYGRGYNTSEQYIEYKNIVKDEIA